MPNDADFPLLRYELTEETLKLLPYFTTLCWIVDFSVFSFIVYTISEIFVFFFPENKDFNISLWWLVVLGVFILQVNRLIFVRCHVKTRKLFSHFKSEKCKIFFLVDYLWFGLFFAKLKNFDITPKF